MCDPEWEVMCVVSVHAPDKDVGHKYRAEQILT